MRRPDSTIEKKTSRMKRCSKCKNYKDTSDFGKNRNAKDGLRYRCKECEHQYSRKYYRLDKQRVRKTYSYSESHRVIDGIEQKRCPKCKKWKDYKGYGVKPDSKDGLRCWCKDCESRYSHDYYRQNEKEVRKYYKYDKCHRVIEGVKEKRCSKCKRWKAESEFYKICCNKDGLDYRCKECSNKATNKCHRRRKAVRN